MKICDAMRASVTKTLLWREPLDVAACIPAEESCWALLYSGLRNEFTGRYSYLALRPHQEIISDHFPDTLPKGEWFGYLGYGLKNTLEKLPVDIVSTINPPPLWLVQYRLVLCFDHEERVIRVVAHSDEDLASIPVQKIARGEKAAIVSVTSNMTKPQYQNHVRTIKSAIEQGMVYQANLTRKFIVEFDRAPQPFALFTRLCAASPAPYSAFMKLKDYAVISSSPEQFLRIDASGKVETRPIKGSAPKDSDPAELYHSVKNRAENLMIVDLMRNDLSRCCEVGSVKVDELYKVTSYATVHHMASTITAQKRADATMLDVIKASFPPGSMTGAPKIRAMELCTALEQQTRGIYSGAIGRLCADGECDLSVVIRTIIMQGLRCEFQVGGGIVADSDPEEEWQETMTKARGIASALGISMDVLEGL